MPELPEVETVRRGLAPVMDGHCIEKVTLNRPDLRFAFPPRFVERLEGRRIGALGRRAKYLLAPLDSGEVLVMHLGMSGSFRVEDGVVAAGAFHHVRGKQARHDHVIFALEGGARVVYNDPRRFGAMDLVAAADYADYPAFARLGPEPVGNALSGAVLADRFAGKRTPVKAALLDQSVVAGLGNIYVCEALHRAGIHPGRPVAGLSDTECARLAGDIRSVIAEAIAAGGSSLKDYVRADGSLGYFQHSFRVYDREGAPCPRVGCGGTVARIVQSGRSTFYCPRCQPDREN